MFENCNNRREYWGRELPPDKIESVSFEIYLFEKFYCCFNCPSPLINHKRLNSVFQEDCCIIVPMSKESMMAYASQKLHDGSMEAIERIAGTTPAKKVMRKVSGYLIEKGESLFEYNGLQESIEATRPYLERGHKLVILSSHKSHGEIAPAVHIMEEFMRQNPDLLDEFVLPIAASMGGGQQGQIIKTLHDEALVPNMLPRHIRPVPVITDNDVRKRGMIRNPVANGLAIVKPLRREGTGFFIFIEGSVQGGRKNPDTGDIYGLQQPDSMLEQLLDYSKKRNFPMVFLMAGMTKTHTLFSADGKFFTPEWAQAMVTNKLNPDVTYASINMSGPIPSESLWPCEVSQVADNLMIGLSSYLPEGERGVFRNADYLLRT